jgi:putative thioredoxin
VTAQFSRPGAIDLSALRKPAGSQPPGGGAAVGSGAYVVDITTEQALRSEVVERSLSVVVLVSFWSPSSAASVQINATLEQLADELAGRFLLARVDVAAQPQLAQALGIPQAPLVVAALRGQLAPLIQEPLPLEQMRELVQQVLQAAVQGGVTGTVEPLAATAAAAAADESTSPDDLPSRYPEAEAALMSGDFAGAVRAYEQALARAPADAEAQVGLSRARLMQRTSAADPAQARAAADDRPDDVDAQLLVADLDLLDGRVEDAFSRLIDAVRRLRGDDRDVARKHLLELFAAVGDDHPDVPKARQQLASALF